MSIYPEISRFIKKVISIQRTELQVIGCLIIIVYMYLIKLDYIASIIFERKVTGRVIGQ